MSLSSDRLPNPGVEFPLTGNGLARDVFSSMKYPTSSTSSAQSFQQYFYSMTSVDDIHSANPSPASDTNWVARVRAEHDDSGYGRVQGTVSPMEYTTSLIGDVPWCGTTEHPSNRQREESQRPFQPDLFRHLPGNPYPQPLSPPRPVPLQSTRIPLPTFENQWGSPHQVQSAPNSSSRNIQPTVALKSSGRDPIGHHSLGWTLNEGTRESHQHNNSNLHRGELERQNYKCHWLPATGWRTSSEHDVAERNQFHAGHPSESRHEEYEPFHYPAQRDSATRRRQYDISNPPFDMQSQIRHLEPATATFPSYDKGPLPSSFSSTMELFSGPPSSSNLTAFQFEEDFRTNKSAKKVTLLKHVVPQVLFTDPMTLENRPQYDDETDEDSDSEEEEEEEESDEGEESDPEGAERRS
ncbi:hypothetical protein CPB84DRAFT_1803384 [Gymnopilus junonius]|uniref:Uncharacterized protein n=1 Tax=Gymnopilus junonius TaxID=109634 RepID=A0A9P5N6Y9_GYMJU|nr:hypothetical protein CPB84DRAFT_1803384 [Gymnopilus junonius]